MITVLFSNQQVEERKGMGMEADLKQGGPWLGRGQPLTVVRDDGPGHGRGIDSADHPEHAEPAQMLAPLLSGQHFRKVGEHDGHGSSDPARDTENMGVQGLNCHVRYRGQNQSKLSQHRLSIPAYQRMYTFYYFITLIDSVLYNRVLSL